MFVYIYQISKHKTNLDLLKKLNYICCGQGFLTVVTSCDPQELAS